MRDIRSTWFSLFIRKIPLLLLFYSPKFLEALLGIVLRNLLVMLFHTWFPQKTIRAETKLVLLTAKKISWQRIVNRAKQWICKNIWLITTSVDTLMIVVIYNVTGWRRIYIYTYSMPRRISRKRLVSGQNSPMFSLSFLLLKNNNNKSVL